MPDVSIIIVNWNSKAYLQQCLDSLFRHCRNVELEVIVVDNASYDGCDRMLVERFSSVRYVQSDKNLGFARANNLGVRQASGRFLLFLNPDTELLEDSLTIMMDRLQGSQDAGAVGCKLLNTDRTFQTSCVQPFPTVLNQVLGTDCLRAQFPGWSIWGTNTVRADERQPSLVQVISGACILMKREVFNVIGGFTERYFMYGEDLDLCFKVKQAGFRVYYLPETSLVHHGGGSTQQGASNFSNVMMRESVYRYLRYNRGMLVAVTYRAAMAVSAVLRMGLILPLLAFTRQRVVRHGTGSLRKWFSVLRWSLGFESWTRAQP